MNKKAQVWENIKVRKEIADRLRSHKEKTGVPAAAFVEKAVLDKLKTATNAERKKTR